MNPDFWFFIQNDGVNVLTQYNPNPLKYTVYNTDWFIDFGDGGMERVEGNLFTTYKDFDFLSLYYPYMPSIGNPTYFVCGTGAIHMQTPTIYIPGPEPLALFTLAVCFLARRKRN